MLTTSFSVSDAAHSLSDAAHSLRFHPLELNGVVGAVGVGADVGIWVRVPTRMLNPPLIFEAKGRSRDYAVPAAGAADVLPDVAGRARLGELLVALRFVELVEALFEGCTWRAPTRESLEPAQAWHDDELVALIMPFAETAEQERPARARGLLPEV